MKHTSLTVWQFISHIETVFHSHVFLSLSVCVRCWAWPPFLPLTCLITSPLEPNQPVNPCCIKPVSTFQTPNCSVSLLITELRPPLCSFVTSLWFLVFVSYSDLSVLQDVPFPCHVQVHHPRRHASDSTTCSTYSLGVINELFKQDAVFGWYLQLSPLPFNHVLPKIQWNIGFWHPGKETLQAFFNHSPVCLTLTLSCVLCMNL